MLCEHLSSQVCSVFFIIQRYTVSKRVEGPAKKTGHRCTHKSRICAVKLLSREFIISHTNPQKRAVNT